MCFPSKPSVSFQGVIFPKRTVNGPKWTSPK